jgi:hypothetical protein
MAVNPGDLRVLGDEIDGNLGCALASGDLNGDGYGDLVIAARSAGGAPDSLAGEAYVIFGTLDPTGIVDLSAGAEDVRILGADPMGYLGSSLCVLDFDGDGFCDLALGAKAVDGPPGPNSGEVYLLLGGSDWPAVLDLSAGEEDVRVLASDPGDYTGYALASGDLNGDGFDDLLISAPMADPHARIDGGEVFMILGRPDPPDAVNLAALEEDVRILGAGDGFFTGWSLSCSDLNGDAYDDLIIGCKFADRAYAVFGAPSLPDTVELAQSEEDVLFLGEEGSYFGERVATGDLNGDGFSDLWVGAPRSDPGGRMRAGSVFGLLGARTLPSVADVMGG